MLQFIFFTILSHYFDNYLSYSNQYRYFNDIFRSNHRLCGSRRNCILKNEDVGWNTKSSIDIPMRSSSKRKIRKSVQAKKVAEELEALENITQVIKVKKHWITRLPRSC